MKNKFFFISIAILFFYCNTIQSQWVKEEDFTGKLFYDVFFISPDTGFVCGGKYADPDLCRTYDGGVTWDTIGDEIIGYIESINFINNQVGFITSKQDLNSYIYKTTNQGKSWYPVFEHVLISWTVSFPTENIGFAIPTGQENALITKSIDGGETWEIINSFWTEWGGWGVVDFQFLTEDLGYMIFETGVVYKTTDGGMNFEEVYLDYNYNLNSVFFQNPDTGYIAGEFKEIPFMNDTAGVVLKTVNGGLDWAVDSLPGQCQDIYFVNPDTGYIAALDYLLETHDAGETWQICEGYFTYLLYSVHFPDETTGYAVSCWRFPPGYSALYKMDFYSGFANHKKDTRKINLLPNPARDMILIDINDKSRLEKISIYNQLGQLVFQPVEDERYINISSLKPGVYIIEALCDDWIWREKVIVGE